MRRLKVRDLPTVPGLPLIHTRVAEGALQGNPFRGANDLGERGDHRQIPADFDLGIGKIETPDVQAAGAHSVQLLHFGDDLPGRDHADKLIGQKLVHSDGVVRELGFAPLVFESKNFGSLFPFALVTLRTGRQG